MVAQKKRKIYKFNNKKNSSSNPFKQKKKENSIPQKIGFLIIVLSIVFTFKLLFFHSFFQVRFIHIVGLERIEEKEIQETVDAIMNYDKFFVIPAKNYFLINVREIRDILTNKFPIKSIVVEKNFPNKIFIRIEEKISTIIYDNGLNYSFIGLDGVVVDKIRQVGEDEWLITTETTSSTNELGEETVEELEINREHILSKKEIIDEMGDYPIIYDKRGVDSNINQKVLKKETVRGVIAWYDLLYEYSGITLEYVEIENELGNIVIKTGEGWRLYASLVRDINTQYNQLVVLLDKEIKNHTEGLEYIDLRYKGRAYWK
ncbi:MAG: FtsQ-type POTRA domain-containing protein [Candidatus Magasanikbacteria bacterium]|nr:FtsQ-type POTRA domain-containing protein [Candidatus Magasanikbacteria bacterium]